MKTSDDAKNQFTTFVVKHKKASFLSIGFIILALLLIIIIPSVLKKEPESVTVVESSLKGFSDIEELSVLEYSYSSYTTVYEKDKKGKDNKDKPKYHVAYSGTVRTGFDFKDLKITDDKEKKVIYIDIPDIKINSVSIDENSLDFIFIKDKYETEDIVPKTIPICKKDLEKKVTGKDGANLKTIAEENALSTIKAITEPLKKSLPEGYTIEYR